MFRPTPLPWARPRHELLLLALVAVAALTIVQPQSPQDWTRMCLTGALAHARLTVDGCIDDAIDRSRYGGHLYSDKAPGMSLLSLPGYEAVRLPPPRRWSSIDRRLWLVRLTVCGVAFLLCGFLVGRVAEGLAPRWGGPTLVTFALGTLAFPFAATGFDHVPAMVLGFAAFVLIWSRRPLAAGLVAAWPSSSSTSSLSSRSCSRHTRRCSDATPSPALRSVRFRALPPSLRNTSRPSPSFRWDSRCALRACRG